MATDETERNKALARRFCDATNTNNLEIISTTIDELVAPDAQIRMPLLLSVTGAQAQKFVFETQRRPHARPDCDRDVLGRR